MTQTQAKKPKDYPEVNLAFDPLNFDDEPCALFLCFQDQIGSSVCWLFSFPLDVAAKWEDHETSQLAAGAAHIFAEFNSLHLAI